MSTNDTNAATPGSDAAIALGCKCPRIDNNYGHGLTDIDDGEVAFWIAANCPLHNMPALNNLVGTITLGDDDADK